MSCSMKLWQRTTPNRNAKTVASKLLQKICDGDQEKPFYEVIFQIGNKDDMSAASENGKLARAILDKFMRSFQERNPHLHVFSAHLHMDEATPHLHIDFIPYTTYHRKQARSFHPCISETGPCRSGHHRRRTLHDRAGCMGAERKRSTG